MIQMILLSVISLSIDQSSHSCDTYVTLYQLRISFRNAINKFSFSFNSFYDQSTSECNYKRTRKMIKHYDPKIDLTLLGCGFLGKHCQVEYS